MREFASVNKDRVFADLAAAKFLFDYGVKNIRGIDISPAMIGAARRLFPEIKFETGDLLKISCESNYLEAYSHSMQ